MVFRLLLHRGLLDATAGSVICDLPVFKAQRGAKSLPTLTPEGGMAPELACVAAKFAAVALSHPFHRLEGHIVERTTDLRNRRLREILPISHSTQPTPG